MPCFPGLANDRSSELSLDAVRIWRLEDEARDFRAAEENATLAVSCCAGTDLQAHWQALERRSIPGAGHKHRRWIQHLDFCPRDPLCEKTIDQHLRLVSGNVAGRPRVVWFVMRQHSDVGFVGHFELGLGSPHGAGCRLEGIFLEGTTFDGDYRCPSRKRQSYRSVRNCRRGDERPRTMIVR